MNLVNHYLTDNNGRLGVYRMEQEIRKPYYIIKSKHGFNIHEGKPKKRGGGHAEIILTDEEYRRYDRNKVIEILKPYTDITNRRINYCPTELLLYAIEKVIYERE